MYKRGRVPAAEHDPESERPAMTVDRVLAIARTLTQSGIAFWLDGGWGVDALLGEQTRHHDDLDLVVALYQSGEVVTALRHLGYAVHTDECPTRLVLEARDGAPIDLHTVTFDADGGGIQELPGGRRYRYPPEGFRGRGLVGGAELPCLIPDVQLECHVGYPPDVTDRHDVALLVERFGLEPPAPYGASGAGSIGLPSPDPGVG